MSEMLRTRELCSELEQPQNGEKDNPNAGLEPRTFCYPGRCPKPVRLEGTSLSPSYDHSDHNTLPFAHKHTSDANVGDRSCILHLIAVTIVMFSL